MDATTRQALLAVRRALIALLNVLDDALGLLRTVPSRAERRAGEASR
jgi:hypothetical protein